MPALRLLHRRLFRPLLSPPALQFRHLPALCGGLLLLVRRRWLLSQLRVSRLPALRPRPLPQSRKLVTPPLLLFLALSLPALQPWLGLLFSKSDRPAGGLLDGNKWNGLPCRPLILRCYPFTTQLYLFIPVPRGSPIALGIPCDATIESK